MEFFKTVPRIPFMRQRRLAYLASAVLIIGSCLVLGVRGLNLGIDFTGGVVLEIGYPAAADLDAAREALLEAGIADAQVQSFGSARELMVRVPPPPEDEDINQVSERIGLALRAADPGAEVRRTEVVGPQVGRELTEQGGLAILFTFVLILFYVGFRFEKKMAAGTVLAAIHDPIVILGFFAATQMTLDLSVLAAVLAVIGYSINDSVVIFDRIRENLLTMRKSSPAEVMDASVNQTLSRTLMTSFSTLFVVGSLYLLGGETLRPFSVAILIGVVVGTYSSVFIAAALSLDMKLKAEDLMPVKKDDPELNAMP